MVKTTKFVLHTPGSPNQHKCCKTDEHLPCCCCLSHPQTSLRSLEVDQGLQFYNLMNLPMCLPEIVIDIKFPVETKSANILQIITYSA